MELQQDSLVAPKSSSPVLTPVQDEAKLVAPSINVQPQLEVEELPPPSFLPFI